jgi:hypothetical protein
MSRNHFIASIPALILVCTLAARSSAQSVAPVSYDRAATAAPVQSVKFSRRAPLVGDQLEQNLSVGLNLDTMVRQNQQVLEKSKTALRREQRRIITTTHVENGMPAAVTVRYAEATKEIATGSAEGKLGESNLAAQPVRGKVYRVRREGEALLITDEQGAVPPLDEYEIVALNMDSLGRPNPLADFLAGKKLSIGERISLPNEVAEKLMGLGGELGKVTRFDLTLEKVATIADRRCAIFQSSVEAASNDSSQMRLAVEGPLAIEIDSCRAVEATFAGPIGMSETRGSLSATYQMTGTGKMTVHIASKYSDLER